MNKAELVKEVIKINKLLVKRNNTINDLKKEIKKLMKSENNANALKKEIKLLKNLNMEFKAMAEKAGSDCAKYKHELERLKR